MKQGIRRIVCGIMLLLSQLVIADDVPVSVDLILPADNQELRKLVSEIALSDQYKISTHINALPPKDQRSDYLLIISDALLPLLADPSYKFSFALYVNKLQYEQAAHPNSSAIFNSQPPSRQLGLIEAIVKQKHLKIGVAYKDPIIKSEIEKLAKNYRFFNFQFRQVESSNPVRELNQLIQDSNILLSTGEPELYNAQTIRSILLSSYRHQTLVIGPNEGFVNAGALASVVSSPQQFANDIRALMEQTIAKNRVLPPRFPTQFSVKVNRHVANSMGIELPSETELRNAIEEF